MKLVVLGASGWIGGHIVEEAKSRGHQIIALVRDEGKYNIPDVEIKSFDLNDKSADLLSLVADTDVFVASVGGRALGNHEIVAKTAERLLLELPNTSAKRLLWVGGAGSLEIAPNVKLVDTPEFPTEYKGESIAQDEALSVFKLSKSSLNWTVISPAAELFPGEKIKDYRLGQEQLLMDDQGNSRISVADYAVAFVDEIENAKYKNQRIGVAY